MQSQATGSMPRHTEPRDSAPANPERRLLLASFLAAASFVLGGRLVIAFVTGLPFIPPYLHSFDSINFALSLEKFDPLRNQPQPPGYPFFVGEARLFRLILGSPDAAFAAIQIIVSALAVAMLFLLGRRMFQERAGFIAAALLAVNPAFWYSVLGSPLRPHLAMVSITVAYFCWRAMQGEPKYFYAASLALGVGSGFRPELAAVLFPLWAWTAWRCRGRVRVPLGLVLLAAAIASWVAVLAAASGGLRQMIVAFLSYGTTQAGQTSVLIDPGAGSWRRWAARAVLWNALGVVPWIWTVPVWRRKRREFAPLPAPSPLFLAIWFIPGFLLHLAVHIGEPDHALSTIPALCLAGGFSVAAAERYFSLRSRPSLATRNPSFALWIALIGNLLIFFGRFEVPHRAPSAGFRGWQSLTDAILVGTYEDSYARSRWIDQMAELAFARIHELDRGASRPTLILWARDGEPVWRKAAYYLPALPVYSLDEKGDPAAPVGMAQLWQRDRRVASYSGAVPIRVPLPKGARLIWLISPAAVADLGRVFPLHSAPPVYYSDLPDTAASYRWGSFEFVTE